MTLAAGYKSRRRSRGESETMFDLKLGEDLLTGVIGKTGTLYWDAFAAASMLRYKAPYQFAQRRTFLAKDVAICSRQSSMKLITHSRLLIILKKSKLAMAKDVYKRLILGEFYVQIQKEGRNYPYVTLCTKNSPGARLFLEWIEEYKSELASEAALQHNVAVFKGYYEPIYVAPSQPLPDSPGYTPVSPQYTPPPASPGPVSPSAPPQYSAPPPSPQYTPASPAYVPTPPSAPVWSPRPISMYSPSNSPYKEPPTKSIEGFSFWMDTIPPTKIFMFHGSEVLTFKPA